MKVISRIKLLSLVAVLSGLSNCVNKLRILQIYVPFATGYSKKDVCMQIGIDFHFL